MDSFALGKKEGREGRLMDERGERTGTDTTFWPPVLIFRIWFTEFWWFWPLLLLNARSVCKKASFIYNLIMNENSDQPYITEPGWVESPL